MSAELQEMMAWNAWANQRYRQHLATMDFEELKIDTPYGRLLDRIVHIFASFKMWLQRIDGQSPSTVLTGDDFTSWEELATTWEEYEHLLLDYVDKVTPEQLEKRVSYVSFDGMTYTRTVRHILLHLTAHPNYHRGQISAIFKLKSLPPLPSTDMVVYYLDQGIDTRENRG